MWVFLYDCFFSIVYKDCNPGELMVRARRPGDIEKVWPDAKVSRCTTSDYMYRAAISKPDIIAKLTDEIEEIDYDNFKSAVQDDKLHNAYLNVWTDMIRLQPLPPYSGKNKRGKR